MHFAVSAAVALLCTPMAMAMLAVKSSSYKNGTLTIDLFCYSDAPATYNVELVKGGNTLVIQSGVAPMNGTNTFTIPATAAQNPGSYTVSLINASNATDVYTATKPFTVAATDFGTTASSASASSTAYTTVTESNGSVSVIPLTAVPTTTSTTTVSTTTVTSSGSGSMFTTSSVLTSGSVTSTVVSTGTITPTPSVTSTLTNSSGAATATVTTKSGAMAGAKAPTVAALLGAALLAVLII